MSLQFKQHGFQIIEKLYSSEAIDDILKILATLDLEQQFGIREFLKSHPILQQKVFTPKLLKLVQSIAPNCNTAIKSIYFNKPPQANWIVQWHQDLTINLVAKKTAAGFKNWRTLPERTVVQPHLDILKSIFTLRIHLDDCTKANGALRVIESSHRNGVIDIQKWLKTKKGIEHICEVPRGGVLLMHPLILHASRRTENQLSRRVLHIEFCDQGLPNGLQWKEAIHLNIS